MADAQKAINDSVKDLEGGNKGDASKKAGQAAKKLDQLARQVAGLKGAEMAAKLKAAENMARDLAQKQRDAQSENSSKCSQCGGKKGECQCNSPGQSQSKSQSKSKGQGQGQGEGQGQGQGQGEEGNKSNSEGDGSASSTQLADRQRDDAEEARSLEDILNELQKDAA